MNDTEVRNIATIEYKKHIQQVVTIQLNARNKVLAINVFTDCVPWAEASVKNADAAHSLPCMERFT